MHRNDPSEVPVITTEGVLALLRKINIWKGHGLDSIPSAFLKRYADQISKHLAKIFTVSLQTSELPKDWRKACVVPTSYDGS